MTPDNIIDILPEDRDAAPSNIHDAALALCRAWEVWSNCQCDPDVSIRPSWCEHYAALHDAMDGQRASLGLPKNY